MTIEKHKANLAISSGNEQDRQDRVNTLLEKARILFKNSNDRFFEAEGNFALQGEMELQTFPFIQTPIVDFKGTELAIRKFIEPSEIYAIIARLNGKHQSPSEYAIFTQDSKDIYILDPNLRGNTDREAAEDEINLIFDTVIMSLR